jgi:lantibiotic modifying enzyme
MVASVRLPLALLTVLSLFVSAGGEENKVEQGPPKKPQAAKPESAYRQVALDAARWIRSSGVHTERGTAWPTDPDDPKTVNTTLYSGVPGVVLFFLEAHRSTGDDSYLKEAQRGADHLLAELPHEKETGLYVGLAGIGFALEETYKVTRADKYRDGARHCLQGLKDRARKVGRGVEWGDVTDVISGNAGTGLFLLYAARELGDESARELAVQAGRRLIELGRPAAGGLKWAMDSKFPRLMPNFSHGTAGVAYFLTSLYGETRDKEFLDAARAGAKYLQATAKTDGDVCLICHHEPEGENLFYLGWCHGPVGTARLFWRLHQVTGDKEWLEWVKKCARGITQAGIPEKRTPGFWNNVSQCCGSAGVAEFFLDLHRVTGDPSYLAFSRHVADDLLGKATRDDKGLRWVQAEHRIKPDLLVAQTGYMQGAAGIGVCLLHLDAWARGQKDRIKFPDNPF